MVERESRAGVPCVGEWLPAGLTGVPTCAVEVADRVVEPRNIPGEEG